jgi:adenylyltransferase/sulfurtransferase
MHEASGFTLTGAALDPAACARAMAEASCGALATFEGWVRDHNAGRAVRRLEYEAYPGMARKEGGRILAEAQARFDIAGARCLHRTGPLDVGDCAVWVGVTAAHRGEAFAACRYIIDEIKHRVPIWKKEHYVDGDSGWVQCAHCAAQAQAQAPVTPRAYYARQTRLPGVGTVGQARLAASRVLVVGAGGLGCGALPYLAAAGVGGITIVDGDVVAVDNLHRQVLYRADEVGEAKAERAARRLRALNPLVQVTPVVAYADAATVGGLVAAHDLVLDCTDNFDSKFLLNDTCVALGKPLVAAAIHQFEGQLATHRPDEGGACLRCLWPHAPAAGCVEDCAEAGVLAPVPGVFGAMQAMEALNLLLDLPTPRDGALVLLDLLTMRSRRIALPRRPDCPACGAGAARGQMEPCLEIDWHAASVEGYRMLDIRSVEEAAARPAPGLEPAPADVWIHGPPPFAPGDRVALVCGRGVRSRALAMALHARGWHGVRSLRGGLLLAPKAVAPACCGTH